MAIEIQQADLLAALTATTRIVERKNTIPILSNVLISPDSAMVTFQATDLDLEARRPTPATGGLGMGAFTLSGPLLLDIIKKFPKDAMIAISEPDKKSGDVQIVSGRSKFKLQSLPPADFPQFPKGAFTHEFKIDAKALKKLFDSCAFCVSNEATRYYLNGIYLHVIEVGGDMKLRAVATNGHQLARADILAPEGAAGMPGIIVPSKTVGEVQKMSEAGGEVSIKLSKQKIMFESGWLVINSKLIDGTFPDYQRVIPTGNNKTIDLDCREFSKVVDRVATISDRGQRAKLTFSESELLIEIKDPNSGTAVETMAIVGGPEISIGFNSQYLLEIAARLSAGDIRFVLADAGSPTIIQNPADPDVLFVLMPMRI